MIAGTAAFLTIFAYLYFQNARAEGFPEFLAADETAAYIEFSAPLQEWQNFLPAEWYKKIIDRYSSSKDDNERGALSFAKEHLEWIEDNYL